MDYERSPDGTGAFILEDDELMKALDANVDDPNALDYFIDLKLHKDTYISEDARRELDFAHDVAILTLSELAEKLDDPDYGFVEAVERFRSVELAGLEPDIDNRLLSVGYDRRPSAAWEMMETSNIGSTIAGGVSAINDYLKFNLIPNFLANKNDPRVLAGLSSQKQHLQRLMADGRVSELFEHEAIAEEQRLDTGEMTTADLISDEVEDWDTYNPFDKLTPTFKKDRLTRRIGSFVTDTTQHRQYLENAFGPELVNGIIPPAEDIE